MFRSVKKRIIAINTLRLEEMGRVWGSFIQTLQTLNTGSAQELVPLRKLSQLCEVLAKDPQGVNTEAPEIVRFLTLFNIKSVSNDTIFAKRACIFQIQTLADLAIAHLTLKHSKDLTQPEVALAIKDIKSASEDSIVMGAIKRRYHGTLDIDTYTTNVARARVEKIENTLERIMNQIVFGEPPLELTDIPAFMPKIEEFSEKAQETLKQIGILKGYREPDALSQYFQIITTELGIQIDKSLLDLYIAKGLLGPELDAEVEKIENPGLREVFKISITYVRAKAVKFPQDLIRFQAAEKRLGDIALLVLERSPLSTEDEQNLIDLLKTTQDELSGFCSIGWDLTLIGTKETAQLILKQENTASKKQFQWLKERIRLALELNGVHPEWVQDVHHINYALVMLYKALSETVPDELNDRYLIAQKEEMDAAEVSITRSILRPDYLIADLTAKELLEDPKKTVPEIITAILETGHLTRHDHPELSLDDKRDQLGALLKQTDTDTIAYIQEHAGKLDASLKEKGLVHGLLGEIAKAGNTILFQGMIRLMSKHPLEKDTYNMSLLDYAVLGGSVEILHTLTLDPEIIKNHVLTHDSRNPVPNLVGLACESGNPDMLNIIMDLFPESTEMETRWGILTQADSTGHTPLMRAIMSKNENIAQRMLKMLNDTDPSSVVIEINRTTEEGQSPLILAATHASPEVVVALIKLEANIMHQVPSSRLNFVTIGLLEQGIRYIKEIVSRLSIEKQQNILRLQHNGRTLAFYLLENYPRRFKKIVGEWPLDAKLTLVAEHTQRDYLYGDMVMGVLNSCRNVEERLAFLNSKSTSHYIPLAHFIFFRGYITEQFLASLKEDTAPPVPLEVNIRKFLDIKDEENIPLILKIAKHENKYVSTEETVKAIVKACSPEALNDLLKLEDSDAKTVAHYFAEKANDSVVFHTLSKCPFDILSKADRKGVRVGQLLSEHHPEVFLEAFKTCSPKEQAEIIFRNNYQNSHFFLTKSLMYIIQNSPELQKNLIQLEREHETNLTQLRKEMAAKKQAKKSSVISSRLLLAASTGVAAALVTILARRK